MHEEIMFLGGRKTALYPLDKDKHLEAYLRWVNNYDVMKHLGIHLSDSEQDQKRWFDSLQEDKNNIVLGIETLDKTLIGITGLCHINLKDKVARHLSIIGEQRYIGKGYDIDSHMTLLEYAFNTLKLRRVCSTTVSSNMEAIMHHSVCGYRIEGLLRKHMSRNGHYWDVILFGVFKEEWSAAYEEYKNKG